MLVNTGNKRGSKVIVEKYINDVLVGGYPKEYNALLSFPGYGAITLSQLAELSESAYNDRMNAFEIYVEGEEAGSNFLNDLQAGFERVVDDQGLCPIEYNPVIVDFVVATNTLTWTMLDGSEVIGAWRVEYSLNNGNTWTANTSSGSPRVGVLPAGTYDQDVYFRVKRDSNPLSNYSYEFIKNVGTIS